LSRGKFDVSWIVSIELTRFWEKIELSELLERIIILVKEGIEELAAKINILSQVDILQLGLISSYS